MQEGTKEEEGADDNNKNVSDVVVIFHCLGEKGALAR